MPTFRPHIASQQLQKTARNKSRFTGIGVGMTTTEVNAPKATALQSPRRQSLAGCMSRDRGGTPLVPNAVLEEVSGVGKACSGQDTVFAAYLKAELRAKRASCGTWNLQQALICAATLRHVGWGLISCGRTCECSGLRKVSTSQEATCEGDERPAPKLQIL